MLVLVVVLLLLLLLLRLLLVVLVGLGCWAWGKEDASVTLAVALREEAEEIDSMTAFTATKPAPCILHPHPPPTLLTHASRFFLHCALPHMRCCLACLRKLLRKQSSKAMSSNRGLQAKSPAPLDSASPSNTYP